MISNGGVYVATASTSQELSFVPLTKDQSAAEVIMNGLIVLRLGKWKVRVIQVIDDAEYTDA